MNDQAKSHPEEFQEYALGIESAKSDIAIHLKHGIARFLKVIRLPERSLKAATEKGGSYVKL